MHQLIPLHELTSAQLPRVLPPAAALRELDNAAANQAGDGRDQSRLRDLVQRGRWVMLQVALDPVQSIDAPHQMARLPAELKARVEWLRRFPDDGLNRPAEQFVPPSPRVDRIGERVHGEQRLTELYYTDKDGNRDFTPRIGDEIYLVIRSRNMVGERVDIDLSDNSRDFSYRGKHLPDDHLTGLRISSDIEYVPLTIEPEGSEQPAQ